MAERLVLFVCEHGAAKSVLAATYFNALAGRRGHAFKGVARGMAPDAELPPAVVDGLAAAGLEPCVPAPRALSQADLDAAGLIVSFDQPALAARIPPGTPHDTWDGLPAVSAEFAAASQAIAARIAALVSLLAAGEAAG